MAAFAFDKANNPILFFSEQPNFKATELRFAVVKGKENKLFLVAFLKDLLPDNIVAHVGPANAAIWLNSVLSTGCYDVVVKGHAPTQLKLADAAPWQTLLSSFPRPEQKAATKTAGCNCHRPIICYGGLAVAIFELGLLLFLAVTNSSLFL